MPSSIAAKATVVSFRCAAAIKSSAADAAKLMPHAASATTTASRASDTLDLGQLTRAIAHLLDGYAGAQQQREQKVRERRAVGIDEMLLALDLACAAAEHEGRQRKLIVLVAVAHVAAVQEDRVVEDRSGVAVGNLHELRHEVREHLCVVALDHHELFH